MHHKIELQRARTVHNTMLWQNSDTRTFCRAIQIYSNTLPLYCWPRFFFYRLTYCFSTIYKNRSNTLERWRACFRCILTEIGGYCGKPLMEVPSWNRLFAYNFFEKSLNNAHTPWLFSISLPQRIRCELMIKILVEWVRRRLWSILWLVRRSSVWLQVA